MRKKFLPTKVCSRILCRIWLSASRCFSIISRCRSPRHSPPTAANSSVSLDVLFSWSWSRLWDSRSWFNKRDNCSDRFSCCSSAERSSSKRTDWFLTIDSRHGCQIRQSPVPKCKARPPAGKSSDETHLSSIFHKQCKVAGALVNDPLCFTWAVSHEIVKPRLFPQRWGYFIFQFTRTNLLKVYYFTCIIMHSFTGENLTHRTYSDSTHHLHSNLTKCTSHVFRRWFCYTFCDTKKLSSVFASVGAFFPKTAIVAGRRNWGTRLRIEISDPSTMLPIFITNAP